MQKLHNQPYEQFNQIDGVFMSPTFATTLEKELYEALKASQQIQSLTMQAAAADRAGKDFYAERCREDIRGYLDLSLPGLWCPGTQGFTALSP
jgi:hypothetical protein